MAHQEENHEGRLAALEGDEEVEALAQRLQAVTAAHARHAKGVEEARRALWHSGGRRRGQERKPRMRALSPAMRTPGSPAVVRDDVFSARRL